MNISLVGSIICIDDDKDFLHHKELLVQDKFSLSLFYGGSRPVVKRNILRRPTGLRHFHRMFMQFCLVKRSLDVKESSQNNTRKHVLVDKKHAIQFWYWVYTQETKMWFLTLVKILGSISVADVANHNIYVFRNMITNFLNIWCKWDVSSKVLTDFETNTKQMDIPCNKVTMTKIITTSTNSFVTMVEVRWWYQINCPYCLCFELMLLCQSTGCSLLRNSLANMDVLIKQWQDQLFKSDSIYTSTSTSNFLGDTSITQNSRVINDNL